MPTPALQHEIKKRRPFESASEEAYLSVLRTAAVLAGPFEKVFRAHGLSTPTYNILRILRGEHLFGNTAGIACSEIGTRVVTLVPDMTRLIDRLEGAGLVQRERSSEDRRVVLVRITPKGLKQLEKLDGPLKELHEAQMAHVSSASLKDLIRLLAELRQTAVV